jgi:hypothetical protein
MQIAMTAEMNFTYTLYTFLKQWKQNKRINELNNHKFVIVYANENHGRMKMDSNWTCQLVACALCQY